MNYNDEDEPKDWEAQEETVPEKLEKKWATEENIVNKSVSCPKCKQVLPGDSYRCHLCGAQIDYNSGLLGKFLKWIKRG